MKQLRKRLPPSGFKARLQSQANCVVRLVVRSIGSNRSQHVSILSLPLVFGQRHERGLLPG